MLDPAFVDVWTKTLLSKRSPGPGPAGRRGAGAAHADRSWGLIARSRRATRPAPVVERGTSTTHPIIEATVAYSDRPGFAAARWFSPVLRPLIRRTARQVRVDDLDYAERRYDLRDRGEFPG